MAFQSTMDISGTLSPQPTAPIVTSDIQVEVYSVLRRDLLEWETCPAHSRSAQLKYNLEKELNKNPITLHVTRYIQSAFSHAVDSDICFVGSRQSGVQLTDNWDGTSPIATGHDKTLHIGMCQCLTKLQSMNAVQARARCSNH